VRVVVATHRNLEEQVRSGAFRQDLFHRIYVFPVVLPPLRERPGDIPVLIEYFSGRICEVNGWKAKKFSPAAVVLLEKYAWPGNIRELRNAVERLLLLADSEIDDDLVRETMPRPSAASADLPLNGAGPLSSRVEAFEGATIRAELERTHHNMTETAKALGLERSHLYKKCAQLGIRVKDLRHPES
jgi:two-component system nitrogen regulation response regulator NtrX